jgi:cell division protein ZapA (FtsZ GTPase activity inhibitor)
LLAVLVLLVLRKYFRMHAQRANFQRVSSMLERRTMCTIVTSYCAQHSKGKLAAQVKSLERKERPLNAIASENLKKYKNNFF